MKPFDVTWANCGGCAQQFLSLNELVSHLQSEHAGQSVRLELQVSIAPFGQADRDP